MEVEVPEKGLIIAMVVNGEMIGVEVGDVPEDFNLTKEYLLDKCWGPFKVLFDVAKRRAKQ